jgi:hypothetical protein
VHCDQCGKLNQLGPRGAESEKILGNVELLPSINNSATLPYHDINGDESLLVKNIPACRLPQQKHSGKDIMMLPCFLCGEMTVSKDMRKHVGGHILCTLCKPDTPDECTLQSLAVGDNPCGFCGLDGCHSLTHLLEKKGDGFTITSNCQYHYAQMHY